VFDVRFLSDRRRLVSVGSDDTIRVWHLPTGKELLSLGELRDTRKRVADWAMRPENVVSRDGRTFLLLSSDGAAKILRVPASVEELTQAVRKAVVRCLTLDERDSARLEQPENRPPQWCLTGVDDIRDAAPQSEEAKWPFQGSDWVRWSSAVRRNLDPPLPGTATWEKWSAERSKN
jgi:WD40 repeat protein